MFVSEIDYLRQTSLFLGIILLNFLPRATSAQGPWDSSDIPALDDNNAQNSEMSIAQSPVDPRMFLLASNAHDNNDGSFLGTSISFSTDGGWSWQSNGIKGSWRGDPATAINADGRLFVNYINNNNKGQSISWSDDLGQTWQSAIVVSDVKTDKNHLAIDNWPSSPSPGKLFCGWSIDEPAVLNENSWQVEVIRSTDNGEHWSNRKQLTPPGSGVQRGIHLETGPNNEVYAVWSNHYNSTSPERAMWFAKSIDGGANWSSYSNITSSWNVRGLKGLSLGGGKSMRVNSFPSMAVGADGEILVVWTNRGDPLDANPGPPDIFLISSSDQGDNWTPPTPIVDPSTQGSDKDRWFPWISYDQVSDVFCVVFYDSRGFTNNDSAEVYVAYSYDHGLSWSDSKVSDNSWNADGIRQDGYAGDYIGIVAQDRHVFATWMGNNTSLIGYVSILSLGSTTYNVPSQEAEISEAAEHAYPGDVIMVQGGEYGGDITIRDRVQILADPAYPRPVINSQGQPVAVRFADDSMWGTKIAGFEIKQFYDIGVKVGEQSCGVGEIQNCVIDASQGIFGIYGSGAQIKVVDCVVRCGSSCGVFCADVLPAVPPCGPDTVQNCIVLGVTGGEDGIIMDPINDQEDVVLSNTVVGAGRGISGGTTDIVRQNLVADCTQTGFEWSSTELFECNNAWNNGPDYSGGSTPTGNLSEDPLFCLDGVSADEMYSLRIDSPCAEEHSEGCGLIGALPVQCGFGQLARSSTIAGRGVKILGDLTIPVGKVLTIAEAGSLLVGTMDNQHLGDVDEVQITVDGTLQSTPSTNSVFIGVDSGIAGSWDGIRFGPSESGDLHLSKTRITGAETAIFSEGGWDQISLTSVDIDNFETAGVYLNPFSQFGSEFVAIDLAVDMTGAPIGLQLKGDMDVLIDSGVVVGDAAGFYGLYLSAASTNGSQPQPRVDDFHVLGLTQGTGVFVDNFSPSLSNVEAGDCKWGIQLCGSGEPSIYDDFVDGSPNKVHNCDTGLYVAEDCSADVDSLGIIDSRIGLYTDGTSSGDYRNVNIRYENPISGSIGFKAWSSAPHTFRDGMVVGFSLTGVNVSSAGLVNLGTVGDPGNNHIYSSNAPTWYVTCKNRLAGLGDVKAEKNYWGTIGNDPPPANLFAATIDYTPWLNEGQAPPLGSQFAFVPVSEVMQVLPNPVRGAATIRLDAPGGGTKSEVAIFDAAGRLVRSLANGALPGGLNELRWDGKGRGGEELPGGVYFVRYVSGIAEKTVKVVKLR